MITTRTRMNSLLMRFSIIVIVLGFASVSMDLTHIIINIAAQQPILNLFYPSIYIVFNIADAMWMIETLFLYLLYFGRVYITFKPSDEFALKLPVILFFAVLITLNCAANICYFLSSFGIIQIPVIMPSIRNGAADMFLVTTWLDLLVNVVLLSLFICKLRVIQRRSNHALQGRHNLLSVMTKVTVLGIAAMVSTQLIYIYSLFLFLVIGENDTSYQLFYAFRGTNILLDVVAVYCNLTSFGGGLYRCLFGRCDQCMYRCCKKMTLEEKMRKSVQLEYKMSLIPNAVTETHQTAK